MVTGMVAGEAGIEALVAADQGHLVDMVAGEDGLGQGLGADGLRDGTAEGLIGEIGDGPLAHRRVVILAVRRCGILRGRSISLSLMRRGLMGIGLRVGHTVEVVDLNVAIAGVLAEVDQLKEAEIAESERRLAHVEGQLLKIHL